MEKLILGILMLSRLTIYEIHMAIKQNFQSMCSASIGSIQAAIKKLLENNMITCKEFVEKSVNKKKYSITDSGRSYFLQWLKTPADLTKSKNMELGKLLFMGLVPAEERLALVDEIIIKMEEELSGLENIYKNIEASDEKNQALVQLKKDPEYQRGILDATNCRNISDSVNDIESFETLTLQLGIDSIKFYIQWFKTAKAKIQSTANREIKINRLKGRSK